MALKYLVAFVREGKNDEVTYKNNDEKRKSPTDHNVNGDEIKEFYEDLIKDSTSSANGKKTEGLNITTSSASSSNKTKSKQSHYNNRKEKTHSEQPQSNQFLKYAQEGDAQGLNLCLEENIDINTADQFGWTALMCAVQANQIEAMLLLLHAGADMTKRNNQGMDVFGLVKKLPRYVKEKILNIFSKFLGESDVLEERDICSVQDISFYCELCKHTFSDISREKHESSTIHLFESKLKPKETTYFLNENNKGFQMMLRSGWNTEKGLGSEGQGQKFPVKTVLKKNRKGFGATEEEGQQKAKITHFGPKDDKAVETPKASRNMRSSTISRRARTKKKEKSTDCEMNFRLQFK